jgi:hypothetical protein
MARSADSTGVTVSTGWAIFALAAGIAALLVQTALVPFTAAPQFGLLVNDGDLAIYRNAARAVLDSQALYSVPIPPGGWFTYPPFAALCFVPLAIVSFGVAKVVWFAMSYVALWATIWRCWRVLGYRGDARLALLCLGLGLVAVDIEAVRGTLWQGQINLLLMAVLVWDLTRPASARLRGFSVGLVAGIKLTAIVFLPYLLLTRQWRAVAPAGAPGHPPGKSVDQRRAVEPVGTAARTGLALGDMCRRCRRFRLCRRGPRPPHPKAAARDGRDRIDRMCRAAAGVGPPLGVVRAVADRLAALHRAGEPVPHAPDHRGDNHVRGVLDVADQLALRRNQDPRPDRGTQLRPRHDRRERTDAPHGPSHRLRRPCRGLPHRGHRDPHPDTDRTGKTRPCRRSTRGPRAQLRRPPSR